MKNMHQIRNAYYFNYEIIDKCSYPFLQIVNRLMYPCILRSLGKNIQIFMLNY